MLSILGTGRFYDARISSIKLIDSLSMGIDMDRTRRKRETARKKDREEDKKRNKKNNSGFLYGKGKTGFYMHYIFNGSCCDDTSRSEWTSVWNGTVSSALFLRARRYRCEITATHCWESLVEWAGKPQSENLERLRYRSDLRSRKELLKSLRDRMAW
ncbi:hypothetical protein NPIL_164941 [Nephila pilipes]|uniref:Uncharacterized protein n=1 Tax=Nephila pilipes TaxID=299642 RepID=A0A8X6U0T4_NEPPI|nr:hypothetical protein NPIL_164941 [Nephila pilipes]